MRPPRRLAGLTLVELIVALAIVAVVAAIAAPSLRTFMLQQRLRSAASELLTDIQFARSTALSMSVVPNFYAVNVAFRSDSNVTCYAIAIVSSQYTDCDCTRTAGNVCQLSGAAALFQPLRVVTIKRTTGVSVASSDAIFYRSSGLTTDRTAKTLTLGTDSAGQLNVLISATGLPRICAPAGTNLSGIPSCS